MVEPQMLIACAALAVATYLIRLAGTASERAQLPEVIDRTLEQAVAVLLASVAVTSALYDGQDLAGWTRGAGVLTGVAAAVLRLPLVLVALIAGLTTALLRMIA